jgi:electron transfer flavoprotein beta subunit
MHIAVIMRMTPDLSEDFDLTEDGTDIDREWVDIKQNEFDDHALEEAILLKEAKGATVTAIALAGDGVDRMLQSAIARGADAAIRLDPEDDEQALESRAAAPLFAKAIEDLSADLVITGVQTPEDVYGQLAPYLGAILDWPQLSAASGITVSDKGIRVRQEYSGGRAALIETTLPAVVGLQTASQPPRYVSGSKLRQAIGSDALQGQDAGEPGSTDAKITALRVPESGSGAEMIDGSPEEVAARIRQILSEAGMLAS